jgi:hypothetical protein
LLVVTTTPSRFTSTGGLPLFDAIFRLRTGSGGTAPPDVLTSVGDASSWSAVLSDPSAPE